MSGAFQGYAPPGVYTRTYLDQGVSQILGAVRIPALIGIGQEFKTADNYELVRGSSATRDNRKIGEDLSYQVDGTNRTFTTIIFPIVTGAGIGAISNSPNDIEVYVNNQRVSVSQLDGNTGTFVLVVAPKSGDTLTVNYYYKLTDTRVIDEDVSIQADGVNTTFYTAYSPIVDGTHAGLATTSVNDVIVKVNSSVVVVNEVNGSEGYIVLDQAPLSTDTVTITYYYNMYANTADDLPFKDPISFLRVGLAPNTSDYIEGNDFVIVNNQIHWGTTFVLESGINTSGNEPFDNTQITVQLVDERIYKEDVSAQFTGVENFLTVKYAPIVSGDGRDTVTESPANVKVYVNGAEVNITRIDGSIGKVYIDATPLLGDTVEVSYYRSVMRDNSYTIESKVAGVTGVGEYSIYDQNNEAIYESIITGSTLTVLTWKVDPRTALGLSVDETVTVTFTSATEFTVTSSNASGTGSGATVSGKLGQTFIDDVTGLSFTLDETSVAILGDTITITVANSNTTPVITNATTWKYFIPGLRILVNNTTNVVAGDTAVLTSYDKSGLEPAVGDVYYVTFTYEKVDADYEPKVYTKFKDVVAEYGSLVVENHLTVASWLAFTNGAVAVICKQVKKQTGLQIASDTSFIDALGDLERPVQGLNVGLIVPLTSSIVVHQATRSHVNLFSSTRYRSERIHLFGYPVGTEPQDVISTTEGFRNRRSWTVYPDGGVIGLTDAYGVEREYVLDGSFLSAAIAGLNVNPTYDEATSMTRKNIVGFKRLVRELDEPTKDRVASAGVMVLELVSGSIRVRHSLTTDMSTPLTKRPEIVTIQDRVEQETRRALDSFIGNKILESTERDIVSRVAGLLRGLVERNIIYAYDSNILIERAENDPSTFLITAYYQPIFSTDYVDVTFNLRTRL